MDVLELERSIYTVERDLLALEMRPKQLPHWFYTRLKIKQVQGLRELPRLAVMAMNAKNTDEPYGRSILQGKQDLPELESCGGCCVSLVRSG